MPQEIWPNERWRRAPSPDDGHFAQIEVPADSVDARRVLLCPSILDVGLRPIIALGDLVVPMTVLVFVGNGGGLSGDDLLRRRALRRPPRHVVARKRLGKDVADSIGPAPVVLDDLVGDLAHLWLRR